MKKNRVESKLYASSLLLVVLVLSLAGCTTMGSRESVTVRGQVIDRESGEPVARAGVTVKKFVPGFPMGRLDVVADMEASDEGRFKFSISKGSTIYVYSRNRQGIMSHGGMCGLDKLMENRLEVIVPHCKEGGPGGYICWDEYRTLEEYIEMYPRSVESCTGGSDELWLYDLRDEILQRDRTSKRQA